MAAGGVPRHAGLALSLCDHACTSFLVGERKGVPPLNERLGHMTEQRAKQHEVIGSTIAGMRDKRIGSLARAALKEPLEECAEAIRSMLTRTPPDVRRAIEARGIYLTGGVAGLKGFPTYLGERTGLKVFTVPDPELCAVKGLQKIILDKEYYKKLSYSMLDQNYRWLR